MESAGCEMIGSICQLCWGAISSSSPSPGSWRVGITRDVLILKLLMSALAHFKYELLLPLIEKKKHTLFNLN